ncbi:RNA-binding protein RMD9, mitochondrial [Nakaseomyces bracarensis]|uniref:RNA-binding protein RMD9, mitochondrial n=1 Tax=Nakaseomyces bracarensis TaxID=273131 RepID=A0ABR4NPS8_9SACH
MFRYLSRSSGLAYRVVATTKNAAVAVHGPQEGSTRYYGTRSDNEGGRNNRKRNNSGRRGNNRNGSGDALDEKLNSILNSAKSKKSVDSKKFMYPKDKTSPWYNQLCALDDCLASTLQLSSTPVRKMLNDRVAHPQLGSSTTFWDSISRAVSLYNELKECPELTGHRVGELVHLLHNGLRTDRQLLGSLNKKPDYDAQSFHKEMVNFIYASLNEITEDILNGTVAINASGAVHLLTSYQEMGFEEQIIQIWNAVKAPEGESGSATPDVKKLFKSPSVVGTLLPIIFESQLITFAEAEKLFVDARDLAQNYFPHNLYVGMILTSLKAKEDIKALELFEKLCANATGTAYGYITETHLAFIGQCKDFDISEKFLDRALNNEMPYRVEVQVSYVNSLLNNIWNTQKDFSKIENVWKKVIKFYAENKLRLSVFSSLNNEFFTYFFETYKNDKEVGLVKLQDIISQYNELKGIDEPFLNVILAKCGVWREKEVIRYIEKNFELFNVPKSLISYRILLKALGSVDGVTSEELLSRWQDIIQKIDSQGNTYIANADWAALRDATVKWAQENESSEAAQQRVELYLQIVKQYQKFCSAGHQRFRILKGCSRSFPILAENLHKLNKLDASSIIVPELQNLRISDN